MDFFNLYSQMTDYLLRLKNRLGYLVSFRYHVSKNIQ
jgi:hypothetical protein